MLGIHAKIHDLRMEHNLDHAQVWARIADDIIRFVMGINVRIFSE